MKRPCGRFRGPFRVSLLILYTELFTFDGRKNVKNTILGALSVYAFGMAGSTLSYDALITLFDAPIRLLFLINMLGWGLFTWATMRWFVFGYTSEEE